MTKVSVLITSYNQRDYLAQAIESALVQTHKPYEIIIVDDASSDGSQDIIADYARRYPDVVRPIYHQTNTGVTQVRNDGLAIITGDYVSLLDGDDVYYPQKLEHELARLAEVPDAQIVFSNYDVIDSDGNFVSRWVDDEAMPEGDIFLYYFGHRLPKRQSYRSELVHMASWRELGFYDFDDIYQVLDMRIKLTYYLKATYAPDVLSRYRLVSTGLSQSKPQRHITALEAIYARNSDLLSGYDAQVIRVLRHDYDTYLAKIARDGAWQALKASPMRRGEALRLWWQSVRYEPGRITPLLMVRALMPDSIYKKLSSSLK